MKAKLIFDNEKQMLTFSACLKKTGMYKRESEYNTEENLVVVHTEPYANYFGIYNNGHIFPYDDRSGEKSKDYYKIGDIDLTITVLKKD